MAELEALPEDWSRALAVVAHPDDMEYGAAAAVARWVQQGKEIGYVLVTDGEAGIKTMEPSVVGPARRQEQIEACHAVGVTNVEFLGLPDGLLVEGLNLRSTLCEVIRRHRPEVILASNFRDSWGGPSWNHVDHRVVGRTLLDSVRDAGATRGCSSTLPSPGMVCGFVPSRAAPSQAMASMSPKPSTPA